MLVYLALLDRWDHLDFPEREVLPVAEGLKEDVDRLVHLEVLDLQEDRDCRVDLVTLEFLENLDVRDASIQKMT